MKPLLYILSLLALSVLMFLAAKHTELVITHNYNINLNLPLKPR